MPDPITAYWDKSVSRYRDTVSGKFVSWDTVYSQIEQSLAASTNVADTLASYVSAGSISVDDWLGLMREEIKGEYIRQYLAAVGGREMMTAQDWGSVGGMIADQYRYLQGFAQEIAAGNLTESQIKNRAGMYINSAREAYNRAITKVATAAGYDLELWIVDPTLENCVGCLDFESMGWVKVADNPYKGAYPGSGDTPCMTHCGCRLQFKNSKTGKLYG